MCDTCGCGSNEVTFRKPGQAPNHTHFKDHHHHDLPHDHEHDHSHTIDVEQMYCRKTIYWQNVTAVILKLWESWL